MGDMVFKTPRPWESPIEEIFWKQTQEQLPNLVAQYPIENYRVDFALPDQKVVIELDGHHAHKTHEQRTYDAKRERHLQALGWRVFRFTGSEVHRHVQRCIDELKELCQPYLPS